MTSFRLILATLCFLSCFLLSAGEKSHAPWSYTGDTAADHWGKLDPAYKPCGEGKEQSPIDITGQFKKSAQSITFNYHPSPLQIVNNGHTIQLNIDPASKSSMTIAGTQYNLLQIHFHAPSEHAVDGKLFAMVAHYVHADKNGRLAVVGVLIEEGAANDMIGKAWQHLPADKGAPQDHKNVSIQPADLLPAKHDLYRYDGSLTTPPCSEGVLWNVMAAPVTLSKAQIKAFTDIHGGNNRPLQPLHARSVVFCGGK
ncbi:carbonic anhydrase [Acanthopleuribacter pedis]|uniref:carbonic anhydrase n=1 Tax=Acanthopleuribacter pedis TaxID=442870 RepID=A0A8J7U0Y0_9BACT|nr:carbonic anhydrase family protein [Acanthopleuribacter pedis]MBO1316982.1 carbonic anhydrase family protein [Acanthopleuribacter pedis]